MLASGQHSCPVPSPHTSSLGEIARWPVATHTSSRAWLLSFASSPEPKGAPLTFWPTFFSSRAAPVASRGTALDRFLHSCKVDFCHSLPSFALLSFAVLCLAFLLACSVFTCIAFYLLFSFFLCFIIFPSTLPFPPSPPSSPTAFPTAPPPLPPLFHFPSPPLSFLPSTTIPPCFKGNLPFLLFTDFLILVALAAILPCFALLCYALLSLYFLPSTPSFELFFTF